MLKAQKLTKWKWPKRLEKGWFSNQKEHKNHPKPLFLWVSEKSVHFGDSDKIFDKIPVKILSAPEAAKNDSPSDKDFKPCRRGGDALAGPGSVQLGAKWYQV